MRIGGRPHPGRSSRHPTTRAALSTRERQLIARYVTFLFYFLLSQYFQDSFQWRHDRASFLLSLFIYYLFIYSSSHFIYHQPLLGLFPRDVIIINHRNRQISWECQCYRIKTFNEPVHIFLTTTRNSDVITTALLLIWYWLHSEWQQLVCKAPDLHKLLATWNVNA